MDILKRELAPIPVEAWAEIDEQATRSLKAMLSGRKVVDVSGPMGTDFPGIPGGRLDYPDQPGDSVLKYGIRKVHHIVEVRIPFELEISELDNVVRGARDVDLSALEAAAKTAARRADAHRCGLRSTFHNLSGRGEPCAHSLCFLRRPAPAPHAPRTR